MFEAYKVAVKLTLLDGVTGGLMKISGAFARAHADAESLQNRLNKLKMPALIGAGAVGAGVAGLGLLKGPIEEASRYQSQLLKFQSLGFGDHVNRQADKLATGMKTIGTSATENMALLGDAMAVFKNIDEASMAAPIMARMKFSNSIMYKDQGGARDSKLMDMLKVGELRGGTASAWAMERQAEFAQKVIEGSRNRVDPTAMLQAMKYGGIATRMMTDKAFYLRSEPLIQEVGGSGFGTGMAALYSNLAQGRGSLTAQQELYRLGAMDKSKVQFNGFGALKKALPGAFKGDAAFKDGVEGVGNYLLGLFKNKGITKDDDVIRELGMVASNQRGARLLTTWYQQRQKIADQADHNEHAMGLSTAVKASSETYLGRQKILSAKWENFQLALGKDGGLLDLATKALEIFAKVIGKITAFAHAHPTLTKFAAAGFVLGSVIAVAAGSLGLFAVSLAATKIAMVGLSATSPALATGLTGLATAMKFAGGAALAATAGYAAGTYLYDNVMTDDQKDRVGSRIAHVMAFFGNEEAKYNVKQMDSVRSSQQALHVTVNNTVDEHGISSMVARHMGRMADRPQPGSSGHDGRMSMVSPALAGATGGW